MQETERLTHVRANGIKKGYWTSLKKEEVVQRLGQYEDTKLSPEEVNRMEKQGSGIPEEKFDSFLDETKEALKGYEDNCVNPPSYTGKLCFLAEVLTVTAGNPVELSFTADQIKQVLNLAK